MQQDYVSTISRNAGVPFMEYICGQHDDLEYGQSLYTAWEFAGIHSTGRDYLWGRHGVQMFSANARAVYDHHRLFAQDADPGHALRLGPTQPIGPGSPVIQSQFQRPEDSSQILEPFTAITGRISSLSYALRWPSLSPPCLWSSWLVIEDGHIEYALILTVTRPCPLHNSIHNALLSTTAYYRYSMKEHSYISQRSLLQAK